MPQFIYQVIQALKNGTNVTTRVTIETDAPEDTLHDQDARFVAANREYSKAIGAELISVERLHLRGTEILALTPSEAWHGIELRPEAPPPEAPAPQSSALTAIAVTPEALQPTTH